MLPHQFRHIHLRLKIKTCEIAKSKLIFPLWLLSMQIRLVLIFLRTACHMICMNPFLLPHSHTILPPVSRHLFNIIIPLQAHNSAWTDRILVSVPTHPDRGIKIHIIKRQGGGAGGMSCCNPIKYAVASLYIYNSGTMLIGSWMVEAPPPPLNSGAHGNPPTGSVYSCFT